ncbi:hypothetical protein AURDEDRAFT_128869 [Auricularia subglabra TFB-10046 SS5]|nr:hypothetical protein AURDEDRAFT_128869 [Auricularia subglabra TFB-10046 SS5]
MAAPTARMPVPSDPKAPKFDGDDRDLLSFIEDYEEAADAAKLTPIQKVRRIVRYVSSDVREEIEQYAEFNVDRANPPADCWTNLKTRLSKEYMVTETVRVYTKLDWDSFIAANGARQITTEQELAKLAREVNRFSEGLIKRGSLSQESAARAFVNILENSLGQNLALGLQLARRTKQLAAGQTDDPTKPYTLAEVQEEAQRVIRSGTVGVGIVFKTAPVSAPALAIQTPVSQVTVKTEPTHQQLWARIQELEARLSAPQGPSTVTATLGARAPRDNSCFYCGGRHVISECSDMQNDLARGRCRQDGRRVVYPDGSYIAMNGKRLGERVAEFNAAHPEYERNHGKQAGGNVSAMLVEVGDAWFADAKVADEAAIPEFETTEAEEAWPRNRVRE